MSDPDPREGCRACIVKLKLTFVVVEARTCPPCQPAFHWQSLVAGPTRQPPSAEGFVALAGGSNHACGCSILELLTSSFLLPRLRAGRDTSIVTVKRHFFDFKRNGSLPVGRGFVAVTLTLSRFHCSEDNVFLPGATLWKDIVSIDC